MLIDTHCHLDDPKFDEDREAVMARARARDVGVKRFVTIGCDVALSKRARDLAQLYDDVYFSAGIHPHEAAKVDDDYIAQLEELARHAKCVAIGECGLDYYYNHSPRDMQRRVFIEQIELAKRAGKALVIHVRDAWDECIQILNDQKPDRTIIHCFTGDERHAREFMDLGCYISISGIVTFKTPGALPDVVRKAPIDRLLVETDSPYLAPMPHRGKRNEPSYVRIVAEKLAEIRGISVEELIEQTGENAVRVFGVPT
jgi:TatD DNase family protein